MERNSRQKVARFLYEFSDLSLFGEYKGHFRPDGVAKMLRIHPSTVRRAIKSLVDNKCLVKIPGKPKPNAELPKKLRRINYVLSFTNKGVDYAQGRIPVDSENYYE